jgi:hypothetical protein
VLGGAMLGDSFAHAVGLLPVIHCNAQVAHQPSQSRNPRRADAGRRRARRLQSRDAGWKPRRAIHLGRKGMWRGFRLNTALLTRGSDRVGAAF